MRRFKALHFFILSISLHLVLTLMLLFPVGFFAKYEPVRPSQVIVELTTPDDVLETIRKKTNARDKTKQIVEQEEKSLNDEVPDKDAFLSATNQRVIKETVAREKGEFKNLKSKSATSGPKVVGDKTGRTGPRGNPTVEDLLGTSASALLEKKDRYEKVKEQNGSRPDRTAGTEASSTSDYLRDVDPGVETMLNTREFKYYTYYTRIRRQLSQYWEPRVRDRLSKMFRQGRRISSDQDHITKLLIVLNDQGHLVRVQVLSESGVSDLDEAATDAFRSAAPFPNPPKGIVESDGTVKIRWDFVLES